MPINQYGWQLATGIRKFRVNIGEFYGSTPTYASGTNIDYICWNAIADYLDWWTWNAGDYVFNGPNELVIYLSSLHNDKTYRDRGHMLFALTQNANEVQAIKIETFDHLGVQLGTTDIPNPYTALTDYDQKYICIDVGHKGLTNIASGLTSGDWPIITDDVAYYIISDGSVVGSGGGAHGQITPLKRIDIMCEPKYEVYTLHYLRKSGDFATIHFSKRADTERSTQKSYYKQNPYELDNVDYLYSRSTAVDKPLSIVSQEKLKLNTDWMTDEEILIHTDLIDSPVIYLDLGLGVPYAQLKLVTGSYKLIEDEKLRSIQMDFEYSHQNTRQI